MNCPHCQTIVDDGARECSGCGVFFDKWKEREDNVANGNLSRYDAIANATSSGFNWVILVIVSVAVIAVFYYMSYKERVG